MPNTRWNGADVQLREHAIGRGLSVWAAGSVVTGVALMVAGRAAAGRQHLVWGAIDGAFAARSLLARAHDDRTADARARRLRRVLLVNAALDAGYVAAGMAMRAGRLRRGSEQDGTAVAVQGGFLLAFDLWHAGRLRHPPPARVNLD